MSARNYATCPQCKKNAHDEMFQRSEEIKSQYGKIPEEEYERLKDEFKEWRKSKRDAGEECLAEYYEHWYENGRFKSRYRAYCDCGFEHNMVAVDESCRLT